MKRSCVDLIFSVHLCRTAKRLKYLKQNADQEYSDNGYRQA